MEVLGWLVVVWNYYFQDLSHSTQMLYPWGMLPAHESTKSVRIFYMYFIWILLSQTKSETSSFSLSISFENVDTAKKKLPVHILDGLTLSYKVSANHFL